jgi:hypothetical protein
MDTLSGPSGTFAVTDTFAVILVLDACTAENVTPGVGDVRVVTPDRFTPVKVTRWPTALRPTSGLTAAVGGVANETLSVGDTLEVPDGVTTRMSALPVRAAVTTCRAVGDSTVHLGAGLVPMSTCETWSNPVPVTVTVWPPVDGTTPGDTAEIVGGAAVPREHGKVRTRPVTGGGMPNSGVFTVIGVPEPSTQLGLDAVTW